MEQRPGYSKGDVKYDIHLIIIAPPPPLLSQLNFHVLFFRVYSFQFIGVSVLCVMSAGQDRQGWP